MKPLKSLIIEDEVNNADLLKHFLTKYCPEIEVIGTCVNKAEALTHTVYHTPDPVPTLTVSTTVTSPTNIPSEQNQKTMLNLLYKILIKATRLREAMQSWLVNS